MIATTRGSVASRSQSISFFSNGSIAMAIFGLFHGSLNSGDWAKAANEQSASMGEIRRSVLVIELLRERELQDSRQRQYRWHDDKHQELSSDPCLKAWLNIRTVSTVVDQFATSPRCFQMKV